MRRLSLVMIMLLATGDALADLANDTDRMARYDIDNMTCEQVNAALQTSRAALLRHYSKRPQGLVLYSKHVASPQDCNMPQIAVRKAVPTLDAKSPHACVVIQCREPSRSLSQ